MGKVLMLSSSSLMAFVILTDQPLPALLKAETQEQQHDGAHASCVNILIRYGDANGRG